MKKQKFFQLLSLLLALFLLFGSIPGVSAVNSAPSFDTLMAMQKQAVEANEVLMEFFFNAGYITEYPDYFSGCYIEDNILHIRLVTPTNTETEKLKALLADYEDVVCYEIGQYSQTYLQEYADITAKEFIDQGCNIVNYYVDSITENIVIGVLQNNIENINSVLAQCQAYSFEAYAPRVVVVEAEPVSTNASNVYGGDTLFIDGYNYSTGVCGYYSGGNALVTCGHGGITVGAIARLNGVNIGTVKHVQHSHNDNGDFSIIELNDNANTTHKIGSASHGYTTITDGFFLSPAVGTYVKKYGSVSGYAYGTITAVNVTTTDTQTDVIINGITQVALTQGSNSQGDSGGPYLIGNAFCGIHRGSSTIADVTYLFFTPYSYIRNAGFTAICNHFVSRWTDAGATYHSGYCTICKETVYENHSEYWNNLTGKCTRCGRTQPITN